MNAIGTYYFFIIILVSFHCWIFSWMMFFQQKRKFFSFVFLLTLLLIFLQSSYFMIWGLQNILQTSIVVFLCAFFINLGFVVLLQKKEEVHWLLVLSGFVFFLLILSFLLPENKTALLAEQPILQKTLLVIHIVFFIFTYLVFSILFVNNLLFFIRDLQLKRKKITWNKNFPSLDKLRRNNHFLTNIIFLCLSVAIFLLLFLVGDLQQNIIVDKNLRILVPICFWFFYGIFILGKNFFFFSYRLEAKINFGLYIFALLVFLYEFKQLI
jgi:hypothetical protein